MPTVRLPANETAHLSQILRSFLHGVGGDLRHSARLLVPDRDWLGRVQRYAAPLQKALLPVLGRVYRLGSQKLLALLFQRLLPRRKSLSATGSLTVAFDIYRPEIKQAIEQAALQLATSTLDTARADAEAVIGTLRQELLSHIDLGTTQQELAQRLSAVFDDPRRASRIAITESSRAIHHGEVLAAQSTGVIARKRWLATPGCCPLCAKLDGREVGLDEPFHTHARGSEAYKTVYHPPAHPHCVLGETTVFGSSLVAGMLAYYEGPVVRLRFSSGACATVTPNHMLLTPTGFARAADLVEGDDIICARFGETELLPDLDGPNVNWKPPLAEEVFRSLAESPRVPSSRVPVSTEYLHGDAAFCNGEIDIIRTDGLLRDHHNSPLRQPPRHLTFVPSRRKDGVPLDCVGRLAQVLEGLWNSTDRLVGRSRDAAALLWGHARSTNPLGLGHAPWSQFQLPQTSVDYLAAVSQRIRHCKDAFSSVVTTAKVVQVECVLHRGPVYDFETRESLYFIGNGIVSSNCLCTEVMVLEENFLESD